MIASPPAVGPEVAFKTVATVAAALIGPGGVLVFADLFAKPGLLGEQLSSALRAAVPPGRVWVQNRRKDLLRSLLAIPRIVISLYFLLTLVGLGSLVAVGPEKLLPAQMVGPLAQSLTLVEKIIYCLILFPSVAVYIWKASIPGLKGWSALVRAGRWLRAGGARP